MHLKRTHCSIANKIKQKTALKNMTLSMTTITWKQFKNMPYEVSDKGDVREIESKKYLRKGFSGNRMIVYLTCKNGKIKQWFVDELVAKVFVQNPNNYNHIKHIDKNSRNDCSYNLIWCEHRTDD